MMNFRVEITEDDGDLFIYTDASRINIDEEKIQIDYEGRRATHQRDQVDEVNIKSHR